MVSSKRGRKRKPEESPDRVHADSDAVPALPDRKDWTGWVEMESEPAFFNVMLKELGVRGVKVHEVLSVDEDGLAMLPRPVHALIFLFRYKSQDEQDQYTGAPQNHIWFANQVPDFACATIATLNIINNIPGLPMGVHLRNFKESTRNLDPYERGTRIDKFDFVRRIHNSFASDNDILTADMHAKEKIIKAKRKAATEKAQATRRQGKAKRDAEVATPTGAERPARTSTRMRTSSEKVSAQAQEPARLSDFASEEDKDDFSTPNFNSKKINRDERHKTCTASKDAEKAQPRRSGRARKPPDRNAYVSEARDVPQEGFHFIAYMPVGDHVWKLDGLDYHPHDMGSFGEGGNGADGGSGDWMHVVAPALQNRMQVAEQEGEISFTLLAVVHDPNATARRELAKNILTLRTVESSLTTRDKNWRATLDPSRTPHGTLQDTSDEYDIFLDDLYAARPPANWIWNPMFRVKDTEDLLQIRDKIVQEQVQLRSSQRSASYTERQDNKKARHRRHNYSKFVKGWLGALIDEGQLEHLLE